MDSYNSLIAFDKIPADAKKGSDGEFYWPDGRMVLTYAYSKQDDNKWIVGYHTLGSRKCEKGLVFYSEECARLKWFVSPTGLKQFV
jgi:hypothetical protein